jgi:hypothetical protein
MLRYFGAAGQLWEGSVALGERRACLALPVSGRSDMLGFSLSVRLYVSTLLFPCDNCQTKLTHKVYNDVCACVRAWHSACAKTDEVSVRNERSTSRIFLAFMHKFPTLNYDKERTEVSFIFLTWEQKVNVKVKWICSCSRLKIIWGSGSKTPLIHDFAVRIYLMSIRLQIVWDSEPLWAL